MDYLTYLKTKILEARVLIAQLDETEGNEAVLISRITSVTGKIFEILDYSVNHFCHEQYPRGDIYFPLSYDPDQLEENKKFIRIKKFIGTDCADYVCKAYNIIRKDKYNNCILLLDPASKHRNVLGISKTRRIIDCKITRMNGPELIQDADGGFSIGPLRVAPKANIVGTGNIVIMDQNGISVVESLNTREEPGNALIIGGPSRSTRVDIKLFLNKCIDCCEEILNLWQELRTE